MTRVELLMAVPVTVVLAYPLVMRLLAEAVHPTRLKLADLERELLASGALTKRQVAAVKSNLDLAFDPWVLPWFAVHLPKIVFLRAIGRRPKPMGAPPGEIGVLFDRFMRLSFVSATAANPLFAVVIVCEALILVPIEAVIEQLHTRKADEADCTGGLGQAVRSPFRRGQAVHQGGDFTTKAGFWSILMTAALNLSVLVLVP